MWLITSSKPSVTENVQDHLYLTKDKTNFKYTATDKGMLEHTATLRGRIYIHRQVTNPLHSSFLLLFYLFFLNEGGEKKSQKKCAGENLLRR